MLAFVATAFVWMSSQGQEVSNESIGQGLISLDINQKLDPKDKLQLLYVWKRKAELAHLPQDSVYAQLLHKIGVYEFNVTQRFSIALELTLQALRINTSGRPGASLVSAATDLYNIGVYYDYLSLYKKALAYYDSALLFAARGPDVDDVAASSWENKAFIYFRMGDYEKAVEEGERARVYALQRRDTVGYLHALIQRSQALCFQGKLSLAQADVGIAIDLARAVHDDFLLAGALRSQGLIFSDLREYPKAEVSFHDCITTRIRSKDLRQVSGDYNGLGVFYGDTLKEFHKATTCYLLAIKYAKKEEDSIRMAEASVNLGGNYYQQGKLDSAVSCYLKAMNLLKIGRGADFTHNPTAKELSSMGNKEMIQALFNSKTAILLRIYQQTHDAKWLSACLRTALLTDSLIRDIRHEQLGEQSKLYWRHKTRGFFINALEACYLAHDDGLAFYFMEESRSVLLQDKLNELGANAYLPPEVAAKGERLRIRIVELQQKLSMLADTSRGSRAVLQELLVEKESLEKYIRSLESSYPAYYQYKYADEVGSVPSLQAFLSKNKQRFVEYFIRDTLCFALCVWPGGTKYLRIVDELPGFEHRLERFVNLCADENALNTGFPEFLASGSGIYRLLFAPFHLDSGRVIICQDNDLVPFEALTSSPAKADFLIRDFSFSYVYSARYLLKQREQVAGKGDFLGIAPVNFTAYNGLVDLKLSEPALRNCSAPYSMTRLLVYGDASRRNFIQQVCDYNTATILTHARADSADSEPVLFMNDSVIHLSELQLLRPPAVRLIVLSACQTNAGKNFSGEGIFSLARGFSAAGIPAVAATQWMADETAIYSISQKFNEYIFLGMAKDEALRKAKLFYMFQDKKGSILPCYWADMILIGNTEPIAFSHGLETGRTAAMAVLLVLLVILGFYLAKNTRRVPVSELP
ncbi:MAG TPA: CHAT domain-containing tetratricopeptide repeat protein [Puia sp.]